MRFNVSWKSWCWIETFSPQSFLYTLFVTFSLQVFSLGTYSRSLRPSDSACTPVPLHAPWSRCAGRPLDTGLPSASLRTSSAGLAEVTVLNGKIRVGKYIFKNLQHLSQRKTRWNQVLNNHSALTSPLAPESPDSPYDTVHKKKHRMETWIIVLWWDCE